MKELQTEKRFFKHEQFGNLTVLMKGGEPWFIGKEVAKKLGYLRTADTIRMHCKGVDEISLPSKGGLQKTKIIPESDLYRLVMKSKLPGAEKFQDWIIEEVLSNIKATKSPVQVVDNQYNDKQGRAFSHPEFGNLTVVEINGEPWFIAKEVAFILGYREAFNMTRNLDEDELHPHLVRTKAGIREHNLINESGLYNAILKSKKETAKRFRKWVTGDVLPEIRRTGSYKKEKELSIEEMTVKVISHYKQKVEELEAENIEMKPKAEFFDAVTGSKDTIDIGKASKVLNIGIGRNKLFEFLREQKIFMANNMPYQKYIDYGYFRVVETKYTKPDGSTHISLKTVVYQKGLDFIRKIYFKEGVKYGR